MKRLQEVEEEGIKGDARDRRGSKDQGGSKWGRFRENMEGLQEIEVNYEWTGCSISTQTLEY